MFRVSSTCALVLTDRQDGPHDSRKVPKTATVSRNNVADEVHIAHGYLCQFYSYPETSRDNIGHVHIILVRSNVGYDRYLSACNKRKKKKRKKETI